MSLGMQMSLAATVLVMWTLCACSHPAPPAATQAPAEVVVAPVPAPSDNVAAASSGPAKGKRAPCTTDQSCNRDPAVSALWGHCLKDSGVCECNAGFELHPSGHCQPNAK